MGVLRATFLAGIVLSLASRSLADVRITAKFNNPLLPGDQRSTDGSYEIFSSSFSLAQAVTKNTKGFTPGKPSQGAVVLTKRGDEYDPNFEYLGVTSGSPKSRIDKVVISTTKPSDGSYVPYFDIQLNNVFITGTQYAQTGSSDTEAFSISLNYESFMVTYYEYGADGTLKTTTKTSYSFTTNKAV